MTLNKDELHSLTTRNPLAFGITYIDLLEERQWEVGTRAWATDIYQAVNPWLIEKYPTDYCRRVAITKSTQAGVSTMSITKAFHFAVNWPVRIFYTLPRQQDVLDFTTTRVDPMVRASPYLRDLLGTPDSSHAKQIGKSYLFFMELSVEPRMMPADALFVDEVDLSDQDFMNTALNRLDASRWKMIHYLSTPTVPNYGIHGLYVNSDMRQWLVKCPSCGKEQPIDWDINLRLEGPANKPTKVFYGCGACNTEITLEHIQTGRWVAQRPDLSMDLIGFHVHQMLTTTAWDLYKIWRDPQTKLLEFYRKRLGKPYELAGGSLERDDFLATCFDENYEFEATWDGKSSYYMGADQGNEIQVLICKVEQGSRRRKIVHVELIPLERGFTRLKQLMEIYHIRKAVGDANPNRHSMTDMALTFPGRFLVADYVEQKEAWKAKPGIERLGRVLTNVALARTTGFDGLMESIRSGVWALPGQPPNLHQDVELVIDQVTSLKRDVETRRTASGETQVNVWRKLRADHMAHSWLYMKTAIEIDRGRGSKIAIIGAHKPEEEVEVEQDIYKPTQEEIVKATSVLAEVPKDQLTWYLENGPDPKDPIPFPLEYKLRLARERFNEDVIVWVMQSLLAPPRKAH